MCPDWWRGAALYQIYPRSFYDSSNNGTGDLPGITQKLDYIADLGIEGIWISPFFPSPMKDFGYDISDCRNVDPIFGTLNDFDTLLKKAHNLDLKIIIDLVLSHTSNQHPWFNDPAKKDYYVWANPKPDGSPPNNWVSVFGGSAWEYDENEEQYYLHNFLKEQPDLNFHNCVVQDEVLDIAKFWLERGVDGFRLDVVNFYFHDEKLRDNPPRTQGTKFATQFEGEDEYSNQQHIFDKSRPENLIFLKRLRELMNSYPCTFTIGEIGDDHPYELTAQYTNGDDHLHTTYNTHLMSGAQKQLSPSLIRENFAKLDKQPGNFWPSWAFSNHDVVRAASRWHENGDGFSHDPRLSKMIIALLLCLRGTVFLYQGEELGLPEAKLALEDIQDPWGKHLWPEWQGRDGCRTPMPWDARDLSEKSWLPAADTHKILNVEAQTQDPNSCLNFVKNFINWRKTQRPLIEGDIQFLEKQHEQILSFTRSTKELSIICYFNLSNTDQSIEKPEVFSEGTNNGCVTKNSHIIFEPYGFILAETSRA